MNQNEWVDYFELVNGRKPTPEEFAQAKAAGEFTSAPVENNEVTEVVSQPVSDTPQAVTAPASQGEPLVVEGVPVQAILSKKGMQKKTKITLFSILGAVVVLLLSIGGYSIWRYQSGKIADGVYEVVSNKYYDEDKKKMVDYFDTMEDYDYEVSDFAIVKANQVFYRSYQTYSSTYSSSDSYLVSPSEYDTTIGIILNPWNKTGHYTLSTSEAKDQITKAYEKVYDSSNSSVKQLRKNLIDTNVKAYKEGSKRTVAYTKNGKEFTEKLYNKKGKLVGEITYRQLSAQKAQKRREDYDKAVKKYRKDMKSYVKDYGSYSFYDDDDDSYSSSYSSSYDDSL